MNKAINTKYGEVIRVLQRFDSVDGWVDVGRNGVYNIRASMIGCLWNWISARRN